MMGLIMKEKTSQGIKAGSKPTKLTKKIPPNNSLDKKQLEIYEIKFHRLFDYSQDGILLLDSDTGEITDANPFIEKLIGYTHAEITGKKLWKIRPFQIYYSE